MKKDRKLKSELKGGVEKVGVWKRSDLASLEGTKKDEGEEEVGGRQSQKGDKWECGTTGNDRG